MTELSDTPETDGLARGNHVVPTEWAEQLEKERNEARAQRDSLQALSQSLAETCTKLKTERDEAKELAQQMSESNQVLLADVTFYRNAWEQLKKEKP